MDELHARRVALNEARFRAANERTRRGVDDLYEGEAPSYSMLCECAVTECQDTVVIDHEHYMRARAKPTTFFVKPDHVMIGAEVVVERTEHFWFVEKIAAGAQVARDLA